LGAADSADEQRPITSQLAVPSVSSLKSSFSSAQELSQAKFFKLYKIRIQTGFALRYILEVEDVYGLRDY